MAAALVTNVRFAHYQHPQYTYDKAKAQQLGQQLATAVPDLGRYYQGRLAIELTALGSTVLSVRPVDFGFIQPLQLVAELSQ